MRRLIIIVFITFCAGLAFGQYPELTVSALRIDTNGDGTSALLNETKVNSLADLDTEQTFTGLKAFNAAGSASLLVGWPGGSYVPALAISDAGYIYWGDKTLQTTPDVSAYRYAAGVLGITGQLRVSSHLTVGLDDSTNDVFTLGGGTMTWNETEARFDFNSPAYFAPPITKSSEVTLVGQDNVAHALTGFRVVAGSGRPARLTLMGGLSDRRAMVVMGQSSTTDWYAGKIRSSIDDYGISRSLNPTTPDLTILKTNGYVGIMQNTPTAPLHVHQPTIQSPILTVSSTASAGTNPNMTIQQARVTTTGTSITTLQTIALEESKVYHIEARVIGRVTNAGHTQGRGSRTLIGTFYRPAGGSATQEGTTTNIHTAGGNTVSFSVDGNNVLLRVAADGSADITWHATTTIYELQN